MRVTLALVALCLACGDTTDRGELSTADMADALEISDDIADGDTLEISDGIVDGDALATEGTTDDATRDAAIDSATDSAIDGNDVDSTSDSDTETDASTCTPGRVGSRRVLVAGGVVTFNELALGEWLELHNTMAIDVDLSGWRITGAVAHTFPDGTFIAPRAQLVVPSALPASGSLELISNGGRRMDAMSWSQVPPWPGGQVIAKRDPDTLSGRAENWRLATATPGALPADRTPQTLVAQDAIWRTNAVAPTGWTLPAFDDSAWSEAHGPFAGTVQSRTLQATFTADNHYALYLAEIDGDNMRYVGRDAAGDWMSSDTYELAVEPGDHLFIAAWEGPGDAGTPQMVIGEVYSEDRVELMTGADTFEVRLGPAAANPGNALGNAPPDLALELARDDAPAFSTPVMRGPSEAPWGGRTDYDYSAAFIWLDTFEPVSITNTDETYALFRSRAPIGGTLGTTLSDVTYLRTAFDYDPSPDMRLVLSGHVDGVVYLDGAEIFRGDADLHTPLSIALPGAHVLAVEARGTFEVALTLIAEPITQPPAAPIDDDIVVSELMYHPVAGSEWIELYNRSDAPIDISGWQLADAVSHIFGAGTIIAARSTLVIADELASFQGDYPGVPAIALESGGLGNSGEQLDLIDACGHVRDRVRYTDGGRWHAYADGGGSSLVLRDVRADNAAPEAWVASDESARTAWQIIRYRGVAERSSVGPDGQWEEVIFGLLSAGEVLIEDVRVVADPDGAAREIAPSLDRWRALGTHRESRVEGDALHIIATDPTEHMHNQVVATLSEPIANGTTYEISLRARWLAGDVQLNTRLYFNRLARTTRVDAPRGGGSPGVVTPANIGPTFIAFAHHPLLPRANEPVVVTITARDPDTVVSATLYTSIDGAEFVATPMTGDPFTATIAGAPTGVVVQMYVEAIDASGASATFPARGAASRALYRVGDVVASPLPGLHIIMTPADRTRFHSVTELMSNADTPCTVVYGDHVFYDVGVRAKGSERGRPSDARLGFNIAFDPLDPLRGVFDSLSIDRSEGMRTGQRELLIDQIGARAGLPSAEFNDLVYLVAPRSQQTGAALMQTARFGDMMLDNQFEGGADGDLFEYELIYSPTTTNTGEPDGLKLPLPDEVQGVKIRALGTDREAYRHAFLIKNNRRADHYDGLIAFLTSFTSEAPTIDLAQWLEAYALMALAGATDHYGIGSQHNAQIYIAPDGLARLFPHDLDFLSDSSNGSVVANEDIRRLLDLPGASRIYYQSLHRLLATAYNAAYLGHWRDQFAALLPGQDFVGRHAFMLDRAAFVDAAIRTKIPPIAFAVTATQSAPTSEIRGTAWLDVHSITVDGVAQPITWTSDITWQITTPLEPGSHVVSARDHTTTVITDVTIEMP